MWNVFSLSQEAGVPPSRLMHIEDSYAAYCFDEAVLQWGSYVSAEVRKAGEGKKSSKEKGLEAKQDRKFRQLMEVPDEVRFASPVATK
jgi:hypothetical protein